MTAPGRWPAAINPDTTTLGDLERLAALVAAREPIEDAAPSGREATPPTELDDELDELGDDQDHVAAARSRRAPYVIGAVTAGVGTFAWSCAQVAEAFGGPDAAAAVGAITWVGTAGAVPVLRAAFRHRIPDAWRRRWWLSTASAAAWVDVMVAKGPDLLTVDTAVGMASALLLGGVALGSRWAAAHDVLNPADEMPTPPPPAPEPVPLAPAPRRPQIDTSRAAEIERDWREKVAGGRNPIAPGSTLTNRIHLPHGYRWLVQLDRDGTVGVSSLENDGIAASVALKLGIRASHVMLERLPGDDDREDQALLTVVTQNALAGGVLYEGPDYVDGIIRIGKYGDGTGKAAWVAKNNTGVQSGVVTGGQRSGKSSLLALLGMAYRASNEWIVLFGDADDLGRSSPLLGQVAHDFARGPAEVLQQLQALEALRFVRGPMMGTLTEGPDGRPVPMTRAGQKPAEKLMPAPHLPGIVWILDEFHLLAKDEDLQKVQFVPRVGRVVRLLAKYGVGLIIGTHSALGDDWGGDSALRGMASQGNNVSLRNNNKSEQGIITNGGFSPNTLPTGGGYAFLDDGVRRAMIRIEHSETMADYLPQVLACGHWDKRSEDAYRRYRVAAALDVVANFHESKQKLEAFDAAIASDAPLPGSPEEKAALAAAAAAEAAAAGETPPGAQGEPTSIGGFVVPGAVGGNVVPIRPDVAPLADPSPAPAPVAPAVPVARLSDKAQQVLATLRSRAGHWTTGELADATGLSKPDVSKALRDLVLLGLAHRPTARQGVYAAGPAPEGSA